jgi:hypothetical protein
MRRLGVIVIAAVASALAAGCGGEPPASEFEPTVSEDFVRNKARADLRANPTLEVQEPQSPDVTCTELLPPNAPPPEEDDDATFVCDVEIVTEDGKELGRQKWRTTVELEPATGDTIVRSSRRLESTIATAS